MELLGDLILEAQVEELSERLEQVFEAHAAMVAEGVTDFPTRMNEADIYDEAIKRMEAAVNAMRILNKAKGKLPPEQIKAQRSRVMGNLNRIRALVQQLERVPDGGEMGNAIMRGNPHRAVGFDQEAA